ncbi:MAG TPA: HAMP domain-containing sensor histidine kinase [Tepidisphaeraceae bacterium]|jgi:signal transduction histidine kinase
MPFRWKMAVQIACMIIGLVLISAAAMWGLNGLHENYGMALAGYEEIRDVYTDVGLHLATARDLLSASAAPRAQAAREVEAALQGFELYETKAHGGAEDDPRDVKAEEDLRLALMAAARQLNMPPELAAGEDMQRADLKAINDAIGRMGTFAGRIRTTIQNNQIAADIKRRDTLVAVGALCGGIVLGAIVLGVLQYRGVMLPLRRLSGGVRKIASGEFQERLDVRGRDEFARLAGEFNQMAAELDEFYHRLEQKVADKSKELIRSERLASVGYLAAGLAHEINNPLGIITGYAEYSLGQLKAASPHSAANEDLAKSLQVISDEAFRCKDIIGKLLSLARPGEGKREEVDLSKVAADVVAAVQGLRDYRDRTVDVEASEPMRVNAVETEMKQVVLNLAVNALEAVPPGGAVRIEVGPNDGWVELRVRDNGRGMTGQTLERVFEPFFTDKRGVREPGTGLGLSITHAIIESHGGRIRAASPGPGKGSEFVVQLPAAAQRSVA